jgi:hypothetical protein
MLLFDEDEFGLVVDEEDDEDIEEVERVGDIELSLHDILLLLPLLLGEARDVSRFTLNPSNFFTIVGVMHRLEK